MTRLFLQSILYSSLLLIVPSADAFDFPNPFAAAVRNVATTKEALSSSLSSNAMAASLEEELIECFRSQRLVSDSVVNELVSKLEDVPSISEPAIAPEVYGRWKLLGTTNVDTSSPIQRTAVDAQKYSIYQDILAPGSGNDNENLVVSQVVQFGNNAQLAVDAIASTSAYPLIELEDRKGTGKILGLNILGISLVGEEAKEDPSRPNSRIKFVFDEGNFDFGGFQIPYPVPFRLPVLRDAVKGWIDITYMSERLRISRGNKGTTFVLLKEN